MSWKYVLGFTALAGIGAGGYFLYKYFQKQTELLKQYGVDFLGIKFSSFTEDLITADITVRVHNKSDIEATIKRVYADVYLTGVYIGYTVNKSPFILPAKGSSDIPLQISFANKQVLKSIAKQLLSILTTGDIPYKLKGYVEIKSGFVSASKNFTYEGQLKKDMLPSAATQAIQSIMK